MKHLVLVRVTGTELDSLRGAASRIAGETETEWWTEPRPSGTAFCFESVNTRTQVLVGGELFHRTFAFNGVSECATPLIGWLTKAGAD